MEVAIGEGRRGVKGEGGEKTEDKLYANNKCHIIDPKYEDVTWHNDSRAKLSNYRVCIRRG